MTIEIHNRSKHRRIHPPCIGANHVRMLVLISLQAFALSLPGQTVSTENLHEVRAKIGQLETSLANEAIKFDSAREQIIEIERRLHDARQQKLKLQSELEAKSEHLLGLNADHTRLKSAVDATAAITKKTLVARYILWRQPKLKVLLNNTNIAEVQRHLKYYDYVVAANNKVLRNRTDQLRRLENVEAALKLEASKLRYLRNQADEHLIALTDMHARRLQIAGSLEELLKENEQTLAQLQDDENQLTKLVDDVADKVIDAPAIPTPFEGLKGALSWPTVGAIAKAPGGAMRAGGAKWSGVIIESDPGSEVAAVADGQVAFADWFRNLGLLVIVDHGNGYMSLYGHNQELYKESGDKVTAGEIIATVGDTGGQSRTGLYFEIRQNGRPQDPRKWCKK